MKFSAALFVVLLMTAGLTASGQTASSMADSLRQSAKTAKGLERSQALLGLSKLYITSDFDSSFLIFAEAERTLQQLQNDTTLFNSYLVFGRELEARGHANRALPFFQLSRKMFDDKRVPRKFEMVTHEELGLCYHYLNQLDSSLYHNVLYNKLAVDSLDIVVSLKRIAINYSNKGLPVKSLEYYLKCMHILDSYDNQQQKASIYYNMGNLYNEDGDTEKAVECYSKASQLYKNNPRGTSYTYSSLAVLNERIGKYEESLKWLKKLEAMLPELNNLQSNTDYTFNLANTLTHMGKPLEGIPLFEKAMKGYGDMEDTWGVATCYRQIGEAYAQLKRYAEAEKSCLTSLSIAKKNGYPDIVGESSFNLHQIYAATGQYKKAYEFKTLYHQMQDSLSGEDNKSKLGLLEKEFEVSQAQAQKDALEKTNELQKIKAEADKETRNALRVALLLFIVAAAVAVTAFVRTRAKNRVLAEQKMKIEQQAKELEEAARTKARFFANVSHELRTPVTLLNGMLELMQQETSPASVDKKMEVAVGNSRRLNTLLDEVLELSKLETGRVTLNRKRKELLPLLNRIVLAFQSLMIKKNVWLHYDANALEGVFIGLDEDKFEKIINNLIYNALKFNHENGWIKVDGRLNAPGNEVIITVSDSGVGIPKQDLPFIFDRFFQSSSTDSKNAQGIGIGLSLVKEFVVLHGGDVSVTSEPGQGSVFRLQLPLNSGNEILTEEEEASVIPEVIFPSFEKRPKILVVEDNEEMRYYLREIFGEGFDIDEAPHGRAAMNWLKTNGADLIISDVMMPEMDGYEFLSQLKSTERLKTTPVVMLTARASEEDLLRGLSLGVDDYIVKPFNAKELKIRVINLLNNQAVRKEWLLKPVEKDEETAEPSEDRIFIEKVKELVEKRLGDASLGIADLADHMAMSERQLYRKCGLLIGMTPSQLIKEIRLKAAYQFLLDRKVTKVSELASRVAFDNSAYFSKQFLERFGKKPVDFL